MKENETPKPLPDEPKETQKLWKKTKKFLKRMSDVLIGPTSNEPLPNPADHELIGDITEQLLRNIHIFEIDRYVAGGLNARKHEHMFVSEAEITRYKFRLLVEGYKRLFSTLSKLNLISFDPKIIGYADSVEQRFADSPVQTELFEMMNSDRILQLDNHFRVLLQELSKQLEPEVDAELQQTLGAEKKPQTIKDLRAELLYQKIVDRLNSAQEDEKMQRASRLDIDFQTKESPSHEDEDEGDDTSLSNRSR